MRSTYHTEMYLRNGKIKTEPIDDENEDDSGGQMTQMKQVESVDNNAHHPQLNAPTQCGPFVDCDKVEKSRQLQLNLRPIDIRNPADALKNVNDMADVSNAERPTYCCYLCGSTYRHLCRLKSHMPAHSNERRFKCPLCCKRYKSASSLRFHQKNLGHLANSIDVQQKSSIKKAAAKKRTTNAPKTDLKHEYEQLKQIDLNNMEMEWAPLELGDHVPFIWDESDLRLTLPMAEVTTTEAQPLEMQKVDQMENVNVANRTDDQLKCVNVLNVSDAKNRPKLKPKPSKYAIWRKETVDPSAWYVDILRMSKSKRAHRPAASDGDNHKSSMKNTELAIKYRGAGDIEFTLKKWDSARRWYNRSLCYAELNTYYVSTAYAKRAQCCFNDGMYRACMTDLMLAERSGLPEALLHQLERHKKSCVAMINKQRTQINESLAPPSNTEPMLSFQANSNFPEMVHTLQIDRRHIRACQPIAVGQILIIEKGFVATTTAYYEKCCVCLTNDQNLMACLRCTQAMLCRNCINFHRIECELQMAMNVPAHQWLTKVLRSLLNAIYLFQTIDEMMEFVGDAISSWHKMQPIIPSIDQKSKYRAFLQLVTEPTVQPTLNSMVSKLHAVLLNHPIIGRKFQTTKSQRFLAHLLIHHICVINAFTTKVGNVDSEYGCLEIIAPITSYLKHSCAPNVSKFLLGDSIIVVAMRPIEPHEQLFVSYCDVLLDQNDRQSILQTEYGFLCTCGRCQPSTVDTSFNGQSMDGDAIGDVIQRNLIYLTSNDQEKRKQLTEYLMDVLQRYGRMPWNCTISSAYVTFSLLLSQRFQKKLQY